MTSRLKFPKFPVGALAVLVFTVGQSAVASTKAPVASSDVSLEFERGINLVSLDDGVGLDFFQKFGSGVASQDPHPGLGVEVLVLLSWVQGSSKSLVALGQHWFGGGSDCGAEPVVDPSGFAWGGFSDHHAPLSFEKAREELYAVFHSSSEKLLPKSGNTQNGQSRAKQEPLRALGVCNEWTATPKGKGHSDLTRNREKAAETTVSDVGYSQHQVTACYNQTLLSTVRYVDPLKKGDLSFGGLYYQDMPWYWDRQCPSGRMYFINTSAVHFYVDPMMFFRWTESRSWPNQVVDVRLLLLRLALIYKSRMFLGVIDGFTA